MIDDTERTVSYPKQINNYTIGAEKGRGAYGIVFEAVHKNTEKVAIKILEKIHLSQNADDFKLINSEIGLLKKIYHKNIIRLLELFEDSYFIYIVTDLCEEGELLDYIDRNTKLSEAEALRIFQQITDALNYLNGMGICHRDVKPENILLTNKGQIKLIDFGLGTQFDNENMILSDPFGTHHYACPEIHKNGQYVGALADIWSLGVVLYVMVCGYMPFGNPCDADEKVSELILKGEYEIPDTLSPQLIDLIKNLLEVDPNRRFTFDQITHHPWFTSNNPVLTGGINLEIIQFTIDDRVLDYCSELGYKKNELRHDLLQNKFNEGTAVYKMVVQKMIRQNIPSKSDLFSKEYINYVLDDDNYKYDISDEIDDEIIEKSPSGNIKTELYELSHFSQEYYPTKVALCSECGQKASLMIDLNKIKSNNNCISIVSSTNFSIFKREEEAKIKKENLEEQTCIIQLIELNDESEKTSHNNSFVTESSNIVSSDVVENKVSDSYKEIVSNTNTITNNNTFPCKCKSYLKRTDDSYFKQQKTSKKEICAISPIRQKKNCRANNHSDSNKFSSDRITPYVPCIITKGYLSSLIDQDINTNNNDSLLKCESPVRTIRQTKTTKNTLHPIEEVCTAKNRESSIDEMRHKSPIPVRNISYSPKLGKLNKKTRMTMLPWVIKKIIIDKNQGIQEYETYINRLNNRTFNRLTKLKTQIEQPKLIKVQSMVTTQIHTPNGCFTKKMSTSLLQKFSSKTKIQQIKESKSRFMKN